MDGEPCWPTPEGGYGGGACGAKADDTLVCSMVTSISRGLTVMSLCGGLTLLVITSGDC
jgi:hypothetical protein